MNYHKSAASPQWRVHCASVRTEISVLVCLHVASTEGQAQGQAQLIIQLVNKRTNKKKRAGRPPICVPEFKLLQKCLSDQQSIFYLKTGSDIF